MDARVRAPHTSSWVLRSQPNSRAELRLFCLPHAGGDTWVFHDWQRALPPYVEVCPIRLPGRGSRMTEQPYDDLGALIEALADGMSDSLDMPFAIFGLSMGALIAFELSRRLQRILGRSPALLCVASCRAPQLFNFHPAISHLSPYVMMDALQHRFGAGAGVAGNQDLMDLMLPVLRADLSMCEAYQYIDTTRLECPIAAYAGTHDAWLDMLSVGAWQKTTSGAFLHHAIPGDHFFPVGSRGALLPILARDLEWCTL